MPIQNKKPRTPRPRKEAKDTARITKQIKKAGGLKHSVRRKLTQTKRPKKGLAELRAKALQRSKTEATKKRVSAAQKKNVAEFPEWKKKVIESEKRRRKIKEASESKKGLGGTGIRHKSSVINRRIKKL